MSLLTSLFVIFFLLSYGNPRGLHSFPTRRSSDLRLMAGAHRTNEVSIEANGLQFQYQEWGDARSRHAVVLLHGFAATKAAWEETAIDLAREYRVVALDQRGHGRTQRAPAGDYSRGTKVEVLEAVIAALG